MFLKKILLFNLLVNFGWKYSVFTIVMFLSRVYNDLDICYGQVISPVNIDQYIKIILFLWWFLSVSQPFVWQFWLKDNEGLNPWYKLVSSQTDIFCIKSDDVRKYWVTVLRFPWWQMNASCVILLSFSIIHISFHLNITQTVHQKLVIIKSCYICNVTSHKYWGVTPKTKWQSVSAWMKRGNTFYSVY
jgi:hypothetical protein